MNKFIAKTLFLSSLALANNYLTLAQTNLQETINIYDEGTETDVSPERFEQIIKWSRSVQDSIYRLKIQIERQTGIQRISSYETFFKEIVKNNPQYQDALVRFTLNRSLKISKEILQNKEYDLVGRLNHIQKFYELHLLIAEDLLKERINNKTAINDKDYSFYGDMYTYNVFLYTEHIPNDQVAYLIQRKIINGLIYDYQRSIDEAIKNASKIQILNDMLQIEANIQTRDYAQTSAIYTQILFQQVLENKKKIEATPNRSANNKELNSNIKKSNKVRTGNGELKTDDNSTSSENFNECIKIYGYSLNSSKAYDKCKKIKSFNFFNEYFQQCYNIKAGSKASNVAADECIGELSPWYWSLLYL